MVGEAQSDQSAGNVKPKYLYNCPDCILQIALVTNTQPFFILKELEGDGCRSIALRKDFECSEYDTKLHLMVRLQMGDIKDPLLYHYSQVYLEW